MEKPFSHSKSRFTETLIHENGLAGGKFLRWVFEPGMLFNARRKWWGDRGKRHTPHEGLDLCVYRDQSDNIRRLDPETTIPVMADGVIVSIFDDFLGKSIFIEQAPFSNDGGSFFIFYGHTVPRRDLQVGQPVKRGDLIATIADVPAGNSTILPHVHISLGVTPRIIDCDRLDWQIIGDRSIVDLIDPVDFLDCRYEILEGSATGCQGVAG